MSGASAQNVAILGAGSWGTALAVHLCRVAHRVRLWGRDAAFVDEMERVRANPRYLTDVRLPDAVAMTASLEEATAGATIVVVAVPSHGFRAVLEHAAPFIPSNAILVSATKGLETTSLDRMSQILDETAGGRPIVVLSGPSFAAEVARGLPTAVLAASADRDAASRVQESFRGPAFRLYVTDDVAGVEIGGALKNVIAIAAGAVDGLGLGRNAMAALITRGLVEISRLACAEGGRRETLAGLSGLGDLVLTCTGDLSRNRRVGIELGRGRAIADILSGMRMVAEGVRTTGAALALGARHGIELPIAAQMFAVLERRTSPRDAVEALMLRPQRPETDG
jgi:glycerol-3-phosphate dehydrogenase (NAD(P)+)